MSSAKILFAFLQKAIFPEFCLLQKAKHSTLPSLQHFCNPLAANGLHHAGNNQREEQESREERQQGHGQHKGNGHMIGKALQPLQREIDRQCRCRNDGQDVHPQSGFQVMPLHLSGAGTKHLAHRHIERLLMQMIGNDTKEAEQGQ